MHEMSLINDLMAKILRVARDNGAARVRSVTLQLGPLAHISPEHLREHFVEAAVGTVAEHAALVVETLTDIHHPQAQDIVLKRLEVDDARAAQPLA